MGETLNVAEDAFTLRLKAPQQSFEDLQSEMVEHVWQLGEPVDDAVDKFRQSRADPHQEVRYQLLNACERIVDEVFGVLPCVGPFASDQVGDDADNVADEPGEEVEQAADKVDEPLDERR